MVRLLEVHLFLLYLFCLNEGRFRRCTDRDVLDVFLADLELVIIHRHRLNPLRPQHFHKVVEGAWHEIDGDVGHLDICVLQVLLSVRRGKNDDG